MTRKATAEPMAKAWTRDSRKKILPMVEKAKEKRSFWVDTTCSTEGAAVVVTSRQQAAG